MLLCNDVILFKNLKKKKALNEKIIHRQKSGRPMQVNGAFHSIQKSCVIIMDDQQHVAVQMISTPHTIGFL